MSLRSDVPPDTVGVSLREEGVVVEYLDGRETLYRGVPEVADRTVRTPPGKDVHVLVTAPDETQGVMLYVNDRKTHDDVLESTGVGRVMLASGEREEVFPGVTVEADGYAHVVEADPEITRGRVFVFAEDEFGEESYEIVGKA